MFKFYYHLFRQYGLKAYQAYAAAYAAGRVETPVGTDFPDWIRLFSGFNENQTSYFRNTLKTSTVKR